jgi:hypothetical protein
VRLATGRTTHGSVMEGALSITDGEAPLERVPTFGVEVSLDVKEASASLANEVVVPHGSESPGVPTPADPVEKNETGSSQRVPSLKSTLAVRMAQRAKQPELSSTFAAAPSTATTPAATAVPAIIEKAVLKAEPANAALTLKANLVTVGVIAAFAAVFIAGLLFGFAVYAPSKAPIATAISTRAAFSDLASSSDLVWPDLLEPGAVSPRGQQSRGITSDQAFKLADAKLHDIDGQADAEEARFWLRVGIADALTDDRLRWALTQLGTLYARPQATPSDFAVAHAVWELAAAKKDPVALCFLAQFEEGGHRSPPNKATALKLYQQAKEGGGCSWSDQAIERLSR